MQIIRRVTIFFIEENSNENTASWNTNFIPNNGDLINLSKRPVPEVLFIEDKLWKKVKDKEFKVSKRYFDFYGNVTIHFDEL